MLTVISGSTMPVKLLITSTEPRQASVTSTGTGRASSTASPAACLSAPHPGNRTNDKNIKDSSISENNIEKGEAGNAGAPHNLFMLTFPLPLSSYQY
jgi:hypothetical protein